MKSRKTKIDIVGILGMVKPGKRGLLSAQPCDAKIKNGWPARLEFGRIQFIHRSLIVGFKVNYILTAVISNLANLIAFCLGLLLITNMVPCHANPLAGYCITQQGQKPPPVNLRPSNPNPPRQSPETIEIEFTVKNDLYRLRSDRNDVTLYDSANRKLDKFYARQGAGGGGTVEHLQRVAEDLVLINGRDIDYLARLDLSQSPIRFGALEAITLLPKPTSKIGNFIEAPAFYSHLQYSRVFNRLFVTGHRPTLFGTADPVATEWVNGQARPLPKELYDTALFKELPQLSGVLFIGANFKGAYSKFVFYDGVKATPLLEGYISAMEIPFENRVFLYLQRDKKTFLFELKAGPKQILVSSQVAPFTYGFYDFPEDSRLFLVGSQDILTEIGDSWRTVISIEPPAKIVATQTLTSGNGDFVFTIDNPQTKASTDYFLVRSSINKSCIARLGPDKPIELKTE